MYHEDKDIVNVRLSCAMKIRTTDPFTLPKSHLKQCSATDQKQFENRIKTFQIDTICTMYNYDAIPAVSP
jgi:hypothetical protein